MPGENVQDWSTTSIDNANADSLINWAEGMPRADVNNSARSMQAAIAKWRNLLNGSIVTSGTANAQAFISGVTYTSVPTGLVVKLKIGPGLTNTAAAQLNMDSIGAVTIKNLRGEALEGGELVENAIAEFIYNGTDWILFATIVPDTGLTNIRVFLTSGTYPTVTHSDVKVLAYCKGGGGSGASSNDVFRSGGGGGEGAESWKLTTAGVLSGLAVTVGAGGAAPVFAGYGNTGGASSIGSIITAPGGYYGHVGHVGGTGGVGGVGGTNDWGMPGAAGHTGASYMDASIGMIAPGGGKGGSVGGGAGVANSGGGSCGSNTTFTPGTGGSGIVVCIEYGAI